MFMTKINNKFQFHSWSLKREGKPKKLKLGSIYLNKYKYLDKFWNIKNLFKYQNLKKKNI